MLHYCFALFCYNVAIEGRGRAEIGGRTAREATEIRMMGGVVSSLEQKFCSAIHTVRPCLCLPSTQPVCLSLSIYLFPFFPNSKFGSDCCCCRWRFITHPHCHFPPLPSHFSNLPLAIIHIHAISLSLSLSLTVSPSLEQELKLRINYSSCSKQKHTKKKKVRRE